MPVGRTFQRQVAQAQECSVQPEVHLEPVARLDCHSAHESTPTNFYPIRPPASATSQARPRQPGSEWVSLARMYNTRCMYRIKRNCMYVQFAPSIAACFLSSGNASHSALVCFQVFLAGSGTGTSVIGLASVRST